MGTFLYATVLLIFVSPTFQDAMYPAIDRTVATTLRQNTPQWIAANKDHYLGTPKEVAWADPRIEPERIDFSSLKEEVRSISSSQSSKGAKSGKSAVGVTRATSKGSAFEDLGIVGEHSPETQINIEDILTYFENSNMTESSDEMVPFSVPNSDVLKSMGQSPYDGQPLR